MKGILRDARSIQERDPAMPSIAEVILLYPGFTAVLAHRLANAAWKKGHRFVGLLVARIARDLTGIDIHPGAIIGCRVFIDHGMGTVIGETAVVEDDVVIMHGVTLGNRRPASGKRHPTIRRGAFIGAGALVLGDVEIGEEAMVGAGAVVLSDVPPGATATGNPARITKRRARDEGHHRRDREHAPSAD